VHFYKTVIMHKHLCYFNKFYLYGSHPVLFTTKQTTLIQSNTIQVYFSLISYSYMYTTCFGLYLDHPEECQLKTHKKEGTIGKGLLIKVTIFLKIHNFYKK